MKRAKSGRIANGNLLFYQMEHRYTRLNACMNIRLAFRCQITKHEICLQDVFGFLTIIYVKDFH